MSPSVKMVVVGCEASGTVRREFARLGHWVVSCDIRPADDDAPPLEAELSKRFARHHSAIGYHHQGDIFEFLDSFAPGCFDIGIYHAPCTKILQTGVRWLYKHGSSRFGADEQRWQEMEEGEGEPGYADWAVVHYKGKRKGVDRGIERSAFYSGIAREMALQWAGDAR